MAKTLLYNVKLVDSEIDTTGALLIENDVISALYTGNFNTLEKAMMLEKEIADEIEYRNCNGLTLMPSFIDMHVHFRYPGQTEKEDLASGLNAAVAGGFGTVVLMPNTNPVVSSDKLAHSIETEAASYNMCDVIQSVSITKDFSGTDISHLEELDRVSVITEDGRDVPTTEVLFRAMETAASRGMIVDCHCEDMSLNATARDLRKKALDLIKVDSSDDEEHDENLAKIDAYFEQANEVLSLSENAATLRNIEVAREAGCRLHIAHCSTKISIEAVRRAKESGQKITCEITPHHFGLETDSSEMLRYIVNPPIRQHEDMLALQEAIRDGVCDVISTDHAPHTALDKKNGSPGFPGLETSFAVSYTTLVKSGLITLNRLSELMSANPSYILGLDNFEANNLVPPRGKLRKHYLANLVLVDLQEDWKVDSSKFKTKGKVCPFENKTLTGRVKETWYCGKCVYQS
jgi:dihydroorotase